MRLSDSPEAAAAGKAGVERAELAHCALENLFDIAPDAIFVTDARGRIRDANPRASELFGYTQAELIGQSIDNLVPERSRGRPRLRNLPARQGRLHHDLEPRRRAHQAIHLRRNLGQTLLAVLHPGRPGAR